MVLNFILWVISILIPVISLLQASLYSIWYYDILGVLSIPLIYLLSFGFILMLSFFAGLFLQTKKEIDKPNRFCYWFVYQVNYVLCKLTCKIKVINETIFPKNGRFLLVYNHRSNWDPMVLMSVFNKTKIYYVTKTENMNIPIAGPFIKRAGFIPIDRNNSKNGLKAILKAVKYINDDIGSIAIAPEGTRNKTLEKPLLDFHPGAFKIALKTNVPIMVVTVKNCEFIHKNFPFKRTNVTIEVSKVIQKEDYENMDTLEISKWIYELMKNNLEEDS